MTLSAPVEPHCSRPFVTDRVAIRKGSGILIVDVDLYPDDHWEWLGAIWYHADKSEEFIPVPHPGSILGIWIERFFENNVDWGKVFAEARGVIR